MESSSARLGALGSLALCALLWSTGGLGVKLVPWTPVAIAGTRSLIAGITITLFLALRREKLRLGNLPVQLVAGASYAATMLCYVAAVKLTTAANAILLQYTSPVFTAILGWLIMRERVGLMDWLSVAGVMAGMVLFFLEDLSPSGTWGNLLAIASGMLFSVTFVLVRKQRDASPVQSLAMGHYMAFLFSLPFLLAGFKGGAAGPGPGGAGPWGPGPWGWAALIYLGSVQVGLTSFLMAHGLKHVPALQSMLVSLIEPVLTPVWVLLIVGERPSAAALAGGAIILGVVVARSVYGVKAARAAQGR